MKNIKIYLFATTILGFVSHATAEVSCVSTVSFKWSLAPAPDSKESPAINEEHWTTITTKGATEGEAKKVLQPLIERNRYEAGAFCRQLHENLSGCMAARYVSMGGAYSNLGFTARKSMDDAIKVDCEKLQGKCHGVFTTNVECIDSTPKEEPASDAAAEGAEKDKKGGKDGKDGKDEKKK